MPPRTEEQKVAQAPIEVTLGVSKYQIKLLSIVPQQEWRRKLNAEMAEVVESFQKSGDAVVLKHGLAQALVKFPMKVMDAVFSYAPELPREVIIKEATEEQMATAFSAIMEVAFPFLGQLGAVTQLVAAPNGDSPSGNSTN